MVRSSTIGIRYGAAINEWYAIERFPVTSRIWHGSQRMVWHPLRFLPIPYFGMVLLSKGSACYGVIDERTDDADTSQRIVAVTFNEWAMVPDMIYEIIDAVVPWGSTRGVATTVVNGSSDGAEALQRLPCFRVRSLALMFLGYRISVPHSTPQGFRNKCRTRRSYPQ